MNICVNRGHKTGKKQQQQCVLIGVHPGPKFGPLQAPSTRTRVNLKPRKYFHGYKNYRVHTQPCSNRSRPSTRTRVNLKTLMKHDLIMRWRKDKPAKTCINEGILQSPCSCMSNLKLLFADASWRAVLRFQFALRATRKRER